MQRPIWWTHCGGLKRMASKLLTGIIAMHPAVAAGLAGGTARKR